MKLKKLTFAALIALVGISAMAAPNQNAESKEIARKVAPLLEKLQIEKIQPSGRAGLYEVLTPQGLFYTDKAGSFILFGATMIDTKTKANLTEQRMDELINFKFADFPLQDAIKTVRGKGTRVMVTFEDPNCGYCKKLMQEVNKIDDVTVYTYLVPILTPESATKSKAIWCAPNPSKTWTEYMANNVAVPAEPANCDVPFERNLALYHKLHLAGTPSLYFKNNNKSRGYINAEQIEAKLR